MPSPTVSARNDASGGRSAGAHAEPEIGVYYHRDAHVGAGRRYAIEAVDLALLGAVWWLVSGAASAFEWPRALPRALMLLSAWLYLALLKTRAGTLGYRLFDAKLVNLQGERVALWRATLRIPLALDPVSAIFELICALLGVRRRPRRDKVAGTYVVRSHAIPVGTGRIHYPTHMLGGMSMMMPEVARPKPLTRPDGQSPG